MYLRMSNGVYFEGGGTTTNIGAIKDGRSAIDYSIVGGHRTYISSLDVRVPGVVGGSMVRVERCQGRRPPLGAHCRYGLRCLYPRGRNC